MNSLHSGQTILHYRIIDKIGQGGMGEVYQAEDLKLGRRVALKRLPIEATQDQHARHRFLREARSASALNHPNIVTIHAIEEAEGFDFIVMEYLEGETLRMCALRGPLPLSQVIEWGTQVAEALSAAHTIGLIHRDIKSANILITPRGQAKVLDFGLAKMIQPLPSAADTNAATMSGDLTGTGVIIGTVAYMSPEQTRGEALDARSDIFSLGCVLYEAATGKLPFSGPSTLSIMHEIAVVDPVPPSAVNPDLPPEFDQIIQRALAKQKEQRYASATELAEALRSLKRSTEEYQLSPIAAKLRWAALSVMAALLAITALWFYWRNANLNWGRAQLPLIEKLAREQKYFEAYDLALQVRRYLSDDETIMRLMPTISDSLSITTEPAGAQVYLKRFVPDATGHFPARQLIGTTPLNKLRIARGDYVLSIEKAGYAPFARAISGAPGRLGDYLLNPPPIEVKVKLIEAAKLPARMVFVPGGEYKLVGNQRPTETKARLDDFFIDQYEVSNREYKEFITSGGYLKKEFWKYPFIKDGQQLSWEEAIQQFQDRTGLSGPRSWVNQNFPEGRAEHPVTDITWYEAAAYAEFRGKHLPTLFQWEKAARNGEFSMISANVMPWGQFQASGQLAYRANFNGKDTVPVESFEFGIGPFGCYNMAGNVAEWCLNEISEGFAETGGAWNDPPYQFGYLGKFPGFYSSNRLGFRCALNSPQANGDQGGWRIDVQKEIPVYTPTSDADFKAWLAHYRYDKYDLDKLEAKIEEAIETPEWRREKITYAGAEDDRAIAYLWLPKNFPKPWQVIQYVPAGDVFTNERSVPEHVEVLLPPYIKSGRAVFTVVFKGFNERRWPPERKRPALTSVKYREVIVNRATDLRRGLDYLETRKELDHKQIAYCALSQGAYLGLIFASVEPRYRSVVLMGVGLSSDWVNWITEANPINFAPHITVPKLMLNGRYDENFPWKTEGEPLYKLLREPKELVLYDDGHTPPLEIAVPVIIKWLDKTLGPVKHE